MSNDIVTPINDAVDETDAVAKPDNPFDNLDALKLSPDFEAHAGVEQIPTNILVGKAPRQKFFRANPAPGMRMEVAALEVKEGVSSEIYLVSRGMCTELAGEIKPMLLWTAITRQNDLLLLGIGLPGADGKHNRWHRSLLDAAQIATKQWVRVTANMGVGAYDTFVATGDLPEPEWPDLTLKEIFKLAFQDRYIDSPDHPVVQMLRGAI